MRDSAIVAGAAPGSLIEVLHHHASLTVNTAQELLQTCPMITSITISHAHFLAGRTAYELAFRDFAAYAQARARPYRNAALTSIEIKGSTEGPDSAPVLMLVFSDPAHLTLTHITAAIERYARQAVFDIAAVAQGAYGESSGAEREERFPTAPYAPANRPTVLAVSRDIKESQVHTSTGLKMLYTPPKKSVTFYVRCPSLQPLLAHPTAARPPRLAH